MISRLMPTEPRRRRPVTHIQVSSRVSSQPGGVHKMGVIRTGDTRLAEHMATPLGPARSEPWSFDGFVRDVTVNGDWVGEQVGLLGNLTATNLQRQYPTAPVGSFMTAYPAPKSGEATPPRISNLNILEGETVPNLALLGYGGGADDPHQLQFYNRAGYVDYLLDVYAVVLDD